VVNLRLIVIGVALLSIAGIVYLAPVTFDEINAQTIVIAIVSSLGASSLIAYIFRFHIKPKFETWNN